MKKDAGMKVDNKKGEGSESESEKEDEKNEEYEDEEDIMIWGYEKIYWWSNIYYCLN